MPRSAAKDTDPVLDRYGRKVVPSEWFHLDLEFGSESGKQVELQFPATPEDLKQGKAIFTLAGLGETRKWKLPRCPMPAHWMGSGKFPAEKIHEVSGNNGFGHVLQAEELMVDGKWRRYFGLVNQRGVTVVPAEEVDLVSPHPSDETMWMSLNGSFDWGMKHPHTGLKSYRIKPVDPLRVQAFIANCRGVAMHVPTDFYRGKDRGGPALRKGVRAVLKYRPFEASGGPENDEITAEHQLVPADKVGVFEPEDPVCILETGESRMVLDVDLRDWFEIGRDGDYTFSFEFDGPPGTRGCIQTSWGFRIGVAPPPKTVAQMNESIPPLGDHRAVERIGRLIDDEAMTPGDGAGKQVKPQWSEAVGGIQAAVLTVGSSRSQIEILVVLKNVSEQPWVVPLGHPDQQVQTGVFSLETRKDGGEWKLVSRFGGPNDRDGEAGDWNRRGKKVERKHPKPPLTGTLSPGKMAVVYLSLDDKLPVIPDGAESRVVVQVEESDGGAGSWRGRIATPPCALWKDNPVSDDSTGDLDFPDHYPVFSRERHMGMNMSGEETDLSLLSLSNRMLIDATRFFRPDGVCREFERRTALEKGPAMKLLHAAIAADRGSRNAAHVLLESMKDTDYEIVRELHYALLFLVQRHGERQPPWLLAMVQAALSDQRYVSGLEKTNWVTGTKFRISYLADEDGHLAYALGVSRCRDAVPFLIEMVRNRRGRMAIMALGNAGDQRAVPALLAVVKAEGETASYGEYSMLSPETFGCAVQALAQLRAVEAVPLLLEHVRFSQVIEALRDIGDGRAVPVLRELVRQEGKVFRAGKEREPKAAPQRWIDAKIALAVLEEGDAVPRLCALLGDKSLREFDRREVVWCLGDRKDPRSIPILLRSIRTDPSGPVVNQAITVLGRFKHKAAIEGLIDCFDADFQGKADWKRAYEPGMFKEVIADALAKSTGKAIGTDAGKWRHWWRTEGKSTEVSK